MSEDEATGWLSFTMPNADVEITAYYRPVVSKVATKGGAFGNFKKVKLKSPGAITLKAGATAKVKAKSVRASKKLKVKKYRAIRFESSSPSVATVSAKGQVKAVGPGTCKVYAYAQNGVSKPVKVTVKGSSTNLRNQRVN